MPRGVACKCVLKVPAKGTPLVDDNDEAAAAVVEASLAKGSVDSAYTSSEEDVGTKRRKRVAVPSRTAAGGPALSAAVDPRPAAVVAKPAAEDPAPPASAEGQDYSAALLEMLDSDDEDKAVDAEDACAAAGPVAVSSVVPAVNAASLFNGAAGGVNDIRAHQRALSSLVEARQLADECVLGKSEATDAMWIDSTVNAGSIMLANIKMLTETIHDMTAVVQHSSQHLGQLEDVTV